jgi:hypothetical protein
MEFGLYSEGLKPIGDFDGGSFIEIFSESSEKGFENELLEVE